MKTETEAKNPERALALWYLRKQEETARRLGFEFRPISVELVRQTEEYVRHLGGRFVRAALLAGAS